MSSFGLPLIDLFLSTPSARRATDAALTVDNIRIISIHALREEATARNLNAPEQHIISIHALREEATETGHLP